MVMKRILKAEVPFVLIPDLNIKLNNVGDCVNLLANDVKGRPLRTITQITESPNLRELLNREPPPLSLWDENGQRITLSGDIYNAITISTLKEAYLGGSGSGSSGTGESGYSGYSGESNISGYSGYSGNSTSGYSGYSGEKGETGGQSGYSGYSGYSGIGYSGYSGYAQNTLTFPIDINRFGFLNHTETTISFDGVDTFTLAPTNNSWSYYRAGLKHTITGSKTKIVASPMIDGKLYYLSIDSTDGTILSSESHWTLNDTKVPIATIYWDSTLSPKFLMAEERHTCLIDRQMHRYEHLSEGTRLLSGGAVSGAVYDSTVEADKTFTIYPTTIADEDIFLTLSQLTDPNGSVQVYYNLYRTSTTNWKWQISDMPFKYSGTTSPYGYIEYDNGSGVSTPSQNNRFVNTYLFVSNAVGNSEQPDTSSTGLRYLFVQGRGSYNTAALAYGESFSSFNLIGFPVSEGVALYQLTWDTVNNSSVKGQCVLNRLQKITNNIISTTTVSTANHNALTGLQGGSIGEYYHLTETEYASLQSSGYSGYSGYSGATGGVSVPEDGTIIRDGNDSIYQVVLESKTVTINRDINGDIENINDGSYVWTFSRDLNNNIVSWVVTSI